MNTQFLYKEQHFSAIKPKQNFPCLKTLKEHVVQLEMLGTSISYATIFNHHVLQNAVWVLL